MIYKVNPVVETFLTRQPTLPADSTVVGLSNVTLTMGTAGKAVGNETDIGIEI